MAIYAIITSRDDERLPESVKNNYKEEDYYETPDGNFFVVDSALTDEVARKLGLISSEPNQRLPLGIVIKCGPMNGWYYKALWEWRDEMERRGV